MSGGAIRVEKLSLSYGAGPRALEDISLEIRPGEFFTLLGPSGCGKTSLLRLIAGFEQPSAGQIVLDGQPLGDLPPYRRPVNTVFQSYALFPHLSVAQNVAFGLEEARMPRAQVAARVEQMLTLVQLSGFAGRRPHQLSGGQQQRVALARALAGRPKVLLLDESLSALDQKLRKEMQLELKRLQLETGITFVFVTHDQEEALSMSDRLAVLRAGRLEQVGTPAEVYDHPQSRYVADFVGEMNFLEGRAHAGRAQLEGGDSLPLPQAVHDGQRCTLAVRPERVTLEPGAEGAGLRARVSSVVYSGSDTIYHLELPQQAPFRVRCQNRGGAGAGPQSGDPVRLLVPPEALRVLTA